MRDWLVIVALTSADRPDCARGLLEILRSENTVATVGDVPVVHVHSLSSADWPGGYLADQDIHVPEREGEVGRCDRLNVGVAAAQDSDAEYALFIESDVWPLRPIHLDVIVDRLRRSGKLVAAAAMNTRDRHPDGGLWPGLFAVDLVWQRAKRMFPLDFLAYRQALLTSAHVWPQPTVAECMSGAYFRAVTRDVPELVWRAVASDRLLRLSDLEPVTVHVDVHHAWHGHAIVCDPRPAGRARVARRVNIAHGPTVRRLITDDDVTWFNTSHPHPAAGQ